MGRVALHDSNNMLRSLGFNIPYEEDAAPTSAYDYMTGYLTDEEPTVMDIAGWGDHIPVDAFMAGGVDPYEYAAAMGYDFDC